MSNKNLNKAKKAKNDEFYTMLTDIEKELKHYRKHLKNKVIFCNCDNPEKRNFWLYFKTNFKSLELEKLIATHYSSTEPVYKLEYDGENIINTNLKQNGDFRSPAAIEILKESDIVITNPPFSLFREYVAQLIEYDKDFLIIGNNNVVTYKDIFPLIAEGKMWLGNHTNKTMEFKLSDDYTKWNRIDKEGNKYGKVPAITWFTTLDIDIRHEDIILYKEYTEEEYPKYDNYDAINVNRVAHIPKDYYKPMGVPITFLGKHNKDQFEILDANNIRTNNKTPYKKHGLIKDKDASIQGKIKYARIVIQRKDVKY
jgi:hypothetical protein